MECNPGKGHTARTVIPGAHWDSGVSALGQAALIKEKRNAHTISVGILDRKEEVADLDTDGRIKLQINELRVRIGFIWLGYNLFRT